MLSNPLMALKTTARTPLRAGGVFAAGALWLASMSGWAQTPEIGVTAAVIPNATGAPPTDDARVLQIGTNVVSQERIVTTASGQVQMLFLDESALTIGPNSEIVLDEFIYDPNAETGSLILNATKGVFRVVGGKISKKNAVTLKAGTATIGIRGGIALVNVAEGGAVQATFVFGESLTVEGGGVTREITRPGYFIEQTAPDAPPSDPRPAPAALLEGALSQLEGGLVVAPGEGPAAADEQGVQPLTYRCRRRRIGDFRTWLG